MDKLLHLLAPWSVVKERLKENDLRLTDEDLQYQPGQEEVLLKRLQQKLGKEPVEIRKYIESISANSDKAG